MATYVLFARTEYDKILKAIDLNKKHSNHLICLHTNLVCNISGKYMILRLEIKMQHYPSNVAERKNTKVMERQSTIGYTNIKYLFFASLKRKTF